MNYYKTKVIAIQHIERLKNVEMPMEQIIFQILKKFGLSEKFTRNILIKLDNQELNYLKNSKNTLDTIKNDDDSKGTDGNCTAD